MAGLPPAYRLTLPIYTPGTFVIILKDDPKKVVKFDSMILNTCLFFPLTWQIASNNWCLRVLTAFHARTKTVKK